MAVQRRVTLVGFTSLGAPALQHHLGNKQQEPVKASEISEITLDPVGCG